MLTGVAGRPESKGRAASLLTGDELRELGAQGTNYSGA